MADKNGGSANMGGQLKHVFFCLALVLLIGCSSRGIRVDPVTLNQGNYKVVKAGAKGVSTGFVLLGIPFVSPTYADAKADLYKSVGEKLEGRSIALTNQTSDTGGAWLVLVAFPSITITADVIEFTDQPHEVASDAP